MNYQTPRGTYDILPDEVNRWHDVERVIAEMTCVGSLLIAALAFNMLGITKIKVMNLVPAIFLPIFLCMVM